MAQGSSASAALGEDHHLDDIASDDGSASLEAGATSNGEKFGSMSFALRHAANSTGNNSSGASETSSDHEDYDTLTLHSHTLISSGAGTGSGRGEALQQRSESYTGSSSDGISPITESMRSIPITLKKGDKKGKYLLKADDAELRRLLQMGIERESENQSKSKPRRKFRDLVFTRQFTTFDRQNPESAKSPFHGFFTLFWLGVAIFMLQIAARNYQRYGSFFGSNEIMAMSRRDLIVLGLSDGVMFLSTGFGWVLQVLIAKDFLSWNREGWIIQSIFEFLFMGIGIKWTLVRNWPWTHTVFFVIHLIVFLMKIHSYGFYNGYLSEVYKTKLSLERKLQQLESIEPADNPSVNIPAPDSFSTGYLDHKPSSVELNQRRKSVQAIGNDEKSEIAQVAKAIESGEPLDIDQVKIFERILKWEIEALNEDLQGKCSAKGTGKQYPHNLTVSNHYEFGVLPTLLYELEYPRSESRDWFYIFEKSCAVLGILIIMNLVSQAFIYPVVLKTIEMKEANAPWQGRLAALPSILNDLIFPFLMEYILVWYLIWECILNLLAELTLFSDRGFYSDWWNSVSWDQYARDWNRPVHNFLLRHVYHSSISSLRVNKDTATLITFLLSACVHELVMWCLFKKLRGYLLVMQMMQLPLVRLSRTKFLKNRATLGNLFFWFSIATGPSMISSGYLLL